YQYAAGVTALPSLRGIGDMKPLWVAMTDDATLRTMIQNFNNQNYARVNFGQVRSAVENILHQWAGTSAVPHDSAWQFTSGQHMSARIVETMDRWFGLDTGTSSLEFTQNKGRLYLNEWKDIVDDTMTKLLIQHTTRPAALQGFTYDKATGMITGDLSAALKLMQTAQPATGAARHAYWMDYVPIINTIADVQGYSDEFYRQTLAGTYLDALPDDVINFRSHRIIEREVGQDYMRGTDRGEYIWADATFGLTSSVTVDGGGGDDRIEIRPLQSLSSTGNNTHYIYHRGDGNDTINDHWGSDDRLFLRGIRSNEVQFRLREYDLLRSDNHTTMNDVEINIGTEATVLLENFNLFAQSNFGIVESVNTIEQIIFDDRTVTAAEVMRLARQNSYSNGTDWIYERNQRTIADATEPTQIFDASVGNDFFYFTSSSPIRLDYDLGDGMDRIYGDTMLTPNNGWNKNITVNFGRGINYDNVQFSNMGANINPMAVNEGIVLRINDNDALQFVALPLTHAHNITLQFSEGTTRTITLNAALHARGAGAFVERINLTPYPNLSTTNFARTLTGTNNNDTLQGDARNESLSGGMGNDIIRGEAGNDLLDAGFGNDVYHYTLNGGFDRITESLEGNSDDRLIFGAGLTGSNPFTFANLRLDRPTSFLDSSALLMTFQGQTGGVYLANQFQHDISAIEHFQFADGTRTAAQIRELYFTQNITSGHDIISTFTGDTARIVNGGLGNDRMTGYGHRERLIGGAGNDTILSMGHSFVADTLEGGDGHDYIFNQGAGDSILAGAGNDVIASVVTTMNGNSVSGGDGHDFIRGSDQSADVLNGDAGNDTINAQGGNDTLNGGVGNDILFGFGGHDRIISGTGIDQMIGGGGADHFVVTRGINSQTIIRDFSPMMQGELIDLSAFGTTQALTYRIVRSDIHITLPDNHILILERVAWKELSAANFVGVASLTPDAQNNASLINGTANNDNLNGTGAADIIRGWAGNDSMNGGVGNDVLWGDDGNDSVNGGAGRDQLRGGAGSDQFIWTAHAHSTKSQPDEIIDFVARIDKVVVRGLGFTGGLDRDGGNTEVGELRIVVQGDISTVLSDQVDFAVQWNNTATLITATDFIFA
ncbi:MAG: hypothetical protein EAZ74_01365, partial [Alphaproteobacteria bacterium]